MTVIFAVAKFALGAWLIVIIIPLLVGAMLLVGRQYRAAAGRERGPRGERHRPAAAPPAGHRPGVRRDPRRRPGDPVRADDVGRRHRRPRDRRVEAGERIRARFERQLPGVPLVIVESPYRSLVRPLVRYLEDAADDDGDDVVVVLLPEYVRAPLVGALPLQRERPADRTGAARSAGHPRRRGPVPARALGPGARRSPSRRRSAAAHDPSRVAADPQELREVAPRPDVARLAAVDRPDRDLGDAAGRARCSGRSSRPRTRSLIRRCRAARPSAAGR